MKIKKRLILIPAVLAVMSMIGFSTFKECQEKLSELDYTISQKKMELSLLKQDIDNKKEFVEKWDSIKAFMDKLPGDIMTEYGDFIISLETERNFDLQSTTEEQPIPDNSKMQEIVFKLEFQSNVNDLAEFLGRLDSENNKLLQIKNMTVNYRGNSYRSTYVGYDKSEDKDLFVTLILATPAKVVEETEETTTFTGTILQ